MNTQKAFIIFTLFIATSPLYTMELSKGKNLSKRQQSSFQDNGTQPQQATQTQQNEQSFTKKFQNYKKNTGNLRMRLRRLNQNN